MWTIIMETHNKMTLRNRKKTQQTHTYLKKRHIVDTQAHTQHVCVHAQKTLTPSILLWLNVWPWKLLPNTPLCIRSGRMITIRMCAIVIVAEAIEVIAGLILNGYTIFRYKHAQSHTHIKSVHVVVVEDRK